MKSSFALSALAAGAAAMPTSSKQCPAKSQNANFDDITSIPGAILTPIPTPYRGLYYQGISVATTVLAGVTPGVVRHSGTKYAAIGLPDMLRGTAMLTTNYPSSNIESFQLDSFFYGCVIQALNGATAVPTACTINVTGYKGSDNTVADSKQVCSQTYSYNPTTSLGPQQQAFGAFSDCAHKDLQFATITSDLPGGMAAAEPLLAVVLDDIKYSTKAKRC